MAWHALSCKGIKCHAKNYKCHEHHKSHFCTIFFKSTLHHDCQKKHLILVTVCRSILSWWLSVWTTCPNNCLQENLTLQGHPLTPPGMHCHAKEVPVMQCHADFLNVMSTTSRVCVLQGTVIHCHARTLTVMHCHELPYTFMQGHAGS